MNVRIVTPAARGSTTGNRITAERWARIIRAQGHKVRVTSQYDGEFCDVLVVLHARKGSAAAAKFKSAYPDSPLVVCLTGTDLYGDIQTSDRARRTLGLAARLVALHPRAGEYLPRRYRHKVHIILQSAPRRRRRRNSTRYFRVCVLGNLRSVKDPLRAAIAARRLPPSSSLRVTLVGAALTRDMERRARAEEVRNPRFVWAGERSHSHAMRILCGSDVLVSSSRSEGGANVISEAAMCSLPVLASDIPSSANLLGADYPGLFPVGDTKTLRALMLRAEQDGEFYRCLRARIRGLSDQFHPRHESRLWKSLLAELHVGLSTRSGFTQ